MNKKLFFLAIAALGLAACSNDDVVEINQSLDDTNSISFRPFANGMTRAADEHFNVAYDQFAVTAFHQGATSGTAYFDDVTFQTANGTTYTSQSNKYYWPSEYNLDFYAYAPLEDEVDDDGGAAVTRNDYNEFEVTPGTDVDKQPDFVYAVTKDWGKVALQDGTPVTHRINTTITGVTINFRHAESKVAIQLSNSNANLKITVGDVTIGNLRGTETFTWNGVTNGSTTTAPAAANTDGKYTSGTLTYLNGTWTAASAQTSFYTVTMESDADYNILDGINTKNLYSPEALAQDADIVKNYDMILIPQALKICGTYDSEDEDEDGNTDEFLGAYIQVEIKIQNAATDDYIIGGDTEYVTAMWPLSALTWLPGHKYTYNVDLAGGGYNPTNVDDTDENLDPILAGAEIKFVSVTVDNWMDYDGDDVEGGVQPINIGM